MTDFLEGSLQHSWGKSPKQKAREKEYNAEYYRKHKEKWRNTANKIQEHLYTDRDRERNREDSTIEKNALKYYQEQLTFNKKHGLDKNNKFYQDAIAANEASLKAKNDYNKSIAKQRSQAGAALNEQRKARDLAVKNMDRYANKESDAYAYSQTTKGKIHKAVNEFKSNWKIGAAMISDSAKNGADFVKSLFK